MVQVDPSSRKWRGQPADQRREQRRARLIDAAIAVYGERGFRHAPVKAVCDAAGLTERYFYESFANSEAMLLAAAATAHGRLYEDLRAVAAVAAPGERLAAMLTRYYTILRERPALTRTFLVDIRGISTEIDRYLETSVERFADLIIDTFEADAPRIDRLVALGAVGAVVHIAMKWIADGYAAPLEAVASAACRMCAAAAPDQA